MTVFIMMVRAVILKDILWPQKQEDREEGGWKTSPSERRACDVPNCGPSGDVQQTANTIRASGTSQHREYPGADVSDEYGAHMPSIPEGLMGQPIREKQAEKRKDDMV